jgi:N-acyl homoserine lactone hydrolase
MSGESLRRLRGITKASKVSRAKWAGAFWSLIMCQSCSLSDHRVVPSSLGQSSSLVAMETVVDQPGPIQVQTITSADWILPLGGLVNLNSKAAQDAHLIDRPEPIHIFVHLFKHPRFGIYLVDTGVSQPLLEDLSGHGVSWVTRTMLPLAQMEIGNSTAEVLRQSGGSIQGVFFTHLHVDHIVGLPDIPVNVPLYVGRGESTQRAFKNLFARDTTRLLKDRPSLQEWQFRFDPDRQRAEIGDVVDIFGDRTAFAISVPGHTPGSTAYLLRTPQGPILLTGDTCHTRWGWEHSVEPGRYTGDQPINLESLLLLKALVARHPAIDVRFGHQ